MYISRPALLALSWSRKRDGLELLCILAPPSTRTRWQKTLWSVARWHCAGKLPVSSRVVWNGDWQIPRYKIQELSQGQNHLAFLFGFPSQTLKPPLRVPGNKPRTMCSPISGQQDSLGANPLGSLGPEADVERWEPATGFGLSNPPLALVREKERESLVFPGFCSFMGKRMDPQCSFLKVNLKFKY